MIRRSAVLSLPLLLVPQLAQSAENVPPAAVPLTVAPLTVAPADGWQDRLDEVAAGIGTAVARDKAAVHDPESGTTSRMLMNIGAYELIENRDPRAAEELFDLAFDRQIMDQESELYGVFPQQIHGRCPEGSRCLELSLPRLVPSQAGDYVSATQTVRVNAAGQHILSFSLEDDYLPVQRNYHVVQALVDGVVVGEWDVSGATGRQDVSIDVSNRLAGRNAVDLTFRLYERRGVVNFGVKAWIDEVAISGATVANGGFETSESWYIDRRGEGFAAAFQISGTLDVNSTSFSAWPWGTILNSEYAELLSPAFLDRAETHLRAALDYIERDEVPVVGYTNSRLMRDVNLILLGQALGDEHYLETGRAGLREWLEHARRHGVSEYGSPTYYQVNFSALQSGYTQVADPATRQLFFEALEFLWTDVAANYFPGRQTLSGSHSRDYDFLRGRGSMDLLFYVEGWNDELNDSYLTTITYQLVVSYLGDAYHPRAQHHELALTPEKVVQAATDADRTLDRYNYVTPNYAIGSTSSTFTSTLGPGPTPYDKPINIELASGGDVPAVTVVPDIYDSPYGDTIVGSGPKHQPLFPTTVQHRNALLALLDLNPALEVTEGTYATNIVFPAAADDVILDGRRVELAEGVTLPARTDSVLAVRDGGGCVAARLFRVGGIDGQQPRVVLKLDADGAEHGAARLAAYQYQGPRKRPTTTTAHVGVAFLAGDCANTQDALELADQVEAMPITEHRTAAAWSVEATTPDGTVLAAGRDLTNRSVAHRTVNGVDMLAPSPLTVNGTDYSHYLACTTSLVDGHRGPLTVRDGLTCLKPGSSVVGPVSVTVGGALTAVDTTIAGPVTALGAGAVTVSGATISGPMTVSRSTGPVAITGSTISGPIVLSQNRGAEPLVLSGNRLSGPLACSGNQPAPVDAGVPNALTRPASGQCRGM